MSEVCEHFLKVVKVLAHVVSDGLMSPICVKCDQFWARLILAFML